MTTFPKALVAFAIMSCAAAHAQTQPAHACDVLQREAVEAAAGVSLRDGRKVLANCVYDAADGKGRVTLQVRFRGDRLADFEDRKKAMHLAGGTLAPVAGVGDEAVWAAGPDHLLVRKSGHVLDIDPGIGKAPARDRAIALGHALAGALR